MASETREQPKKVLLRLSQGLWHDLAAWAADDFRSINGQIEYLLTECVRQRRKSGKQSTDQESDSKEGREG